MHATFATRAWGRVVRMAALGAGALALAGCATGYAFVQPDTAGGGAYYTSNGPYAGPDYYDYGGAGWYASPMGWYGGYGPYYGSSFSFSLGFGSGWGWPYYDGFYGGLFGGWPGYAGFGYPYYGYPWYGWSGYGRPWYYRGHRHGDWHGHDGHDHSGYYHRGRPNGAAMAGRRGWTPSGHWRGERVARDPDSPPHAAGIPTPGAMPFGGRGFVRAPVHRPSVDRFARAGQGSIAAPRFAADPATGDARMMPPPGAVAMPRDFRARPDAAFRPDLPMMPTPMAMPHDFRAMPQPAFRAAPMHFSAPAARAPAVRSGGAPAARIP